MRSKLCKVIILLFLAGGLLGITGCGENDLLDEPGDVYPTSLVFSEAGSGDNTISIDVIQDPDCNDDGTLDDPEDFGPTFALLTMDVDPSVAGLKLLAYDIEYIPLTSPLASGGNILVIDLEDSFNNGGGSHPFPSGEVTGFTVTFLTTQLKQQYVDWVNGVSTVPGAPAAPVGGFTNLDQGRYTFRLTCFFEDDNLVDRTMVFERTVFLGNFDNC